jgi:small subunit ribosomal protein S5
MANFLKVKRVKPVEQELTDRLVALNRVSKVVKGGRRFGFSAIVVVGDGKGVVGYGLGKASEVANAIQKGNDDAKKNLIKVQVINDTVPHDLVFKYGASKIILKPAAPGTGILAGGAMRAVLECAGIKDVIGKSVGSNNPHNLVKATIYALATMQDAYEVSQRRGIAVKKVFNG